MVASPKGLRPEKDCTGKGQQHKQNELGIFPLYQNIIQYRANWETNKLRGFSPHANYTDRKLGNILVKMEQTRIELQGNKYHPFLRRDIGGPTRRWKKA
jgi:hypothetical protein